MHKQNHLSCLIQPVRSFLLSQQSGNHIGRSSSQVLLYTESVFCCYDNTGGPWPSWNMQYMTNLLCWVQLDNKTFADMLIEVWISTMWADCQLTVMTEDEQYRRQAGSFCSILSLLGEKCGNRASKQERKSDQWGTEGKWKRGFSKRREAILTGPD